MSEYVESKSDKRIRQTASVTVLILALSAGILSYNALRELAVQAGIHPTLAFLFPITLDGLILAGSLLILYFAVRGKRSAYGLFLTGLGVVVSIAGNVVISPNNLTYQILHATSPVVLFLALESLMILLRARSKSAQEAYEREQETEKAKTVQPSAPSSPIVAVPVVSHAEVAPIVAKAPEKVMTPEVTQHTLETVSPQSLPQTQATRPVSSPELFEEAPSVIPKVVKTEQDPEPRMLDKHSASEETYIESASIPTEQKNIRESFKESNGSTSVSVPAIKVSEQNSTQDETQPPSKREIIRDLLDKDPEMDANAIIDIVGGDRKYVQKLIRAERSKVLV